MSADNGKRRWPTKAPICGAKTRQGDGSPCRRPAGWGTPNAGNGDGKGYGTGPCKLHGGSTRNHRVNAAKQQAAAEAAKLGVPIETDPHDALAYCVAVAQSTAEFLRRKVRELEDDEALADGALHPHVRAFAAAVDQLNRIAKTAVDAGVETRRLELDELVVERLAGAVRAAMAEVELTDAQQARMRDALTRQLSTLDDLTPRRRELAA